ncbi:MAG: NYN domain-containing protein [Oscillospiraceae bacterium]|nr:NYN domain-containing protein [Oscillospiraceae bacterium]
MTIVFYDIENIIGRIKQYHRLIIEYMENTSDFGEVAEHRAYCTWRSPKSLELKYELQGLGISFIETKPPSRHYERIKNFADLHIFIDALDIAYTRPEIQNFVLVSCDSDFLVLAEKLTQMGKKTIIFNKIHKSPEEFTLRIPQAAATLNESAHAKRVLKASVDKHGNIKEFGALVNAVLEECVKSKIFYSVLHTHGISISSIYQHIQNIPRKKKISYKQSGEKKMQIGFAKVLSDSKFCVAEINDTFFVIDKDVIPSDAKIVLPQEDCPEAVNESWVGQYDEDG